MIACITQWIADSENQKMLIGDLILPIFVGILAFVASNSVSAWRTRRRQSMLGAAVCDSLIEELRNGVNMLNATQQAAAGGQLPNGQLPRRSWNGMQTISDDILERLLCLSKGRENRGFPIREIRIHLKNYFDHMIPNWDQVTSSPQWQSAVQQFLGQGGYVQAAQGVLEMTEDARSLLESNSTRWFPK
jgi:hypothetical protein